MPFRLKCPDCSGKFAHDALKPFPRYCPLCKSDQGAPRADDDVVMPFIRSNKTGATDRVYREMEKGSEIRAQVAAEQLGIPASEMSALKITDMNDRNDCEIAAKALPPNPVSDMMAAAPNVTGFRGGEGVEYSGAVQAGKFPNMGARMRTAIQNNHSETVRKHAIGVNEQGKAAIPSTDVVSDRPAREAVQPGYRRRG